MKISLKILALWTLVLLSSCRVFGVCLNGAQCAKDEATYGTSTSTTTGSCGSSLLAVPSLATAATTTQWQANSGTTAETITFSQNCAFTSNLANCAMVGTFTDSAPGGSSGSLTLVISQPVLAAGTTSPAVVGCFSAVTGVTGVQPMTINCTYSIAGTGSASVLTVSSCSNAGGTQARSSSGYTKAN